jgi:hypothetical protein
MSVASVSVTCLTTVTRCVNDIAFFCKARSAYRRFHLRLGWQAFRSTSGKVADYLSKSKNLIQSNDLSSLFQTSPQPWAETV